MLNTPPLYGITTLSPFRWAAAGSAAALGLVAGEVEAQPTNMAAPKVIVATARIEAADLIVHLKQKRESRTGPATHIAAGQFVNSLPKIY